MQHPTATASDTHHEAHEVQLQLIRQMAPVRHIQRTVELSGQLKSMSLAALARLHPELSEQEIRLMFIEQVYGKELADGVRELWAGRNGQ